MFVGIHAYTGCDSVSAFACKGKLQALKMTTDDQDLQKLFTSLGSSWEVGEQQMGLFEKFTCQLYARKTDTGDINALRYHFSVRKRVTLNPINYHHVNQH